MKKISEVFEGLDEQDSKSLDYLSKAIVANNLPGFDYLEYKQAIYTLKGMQFDEDTAYKSAFATAATIGLTKDKLVKSAQHYQTVLEKEKAQFDDALRKQMSQRVAIREQQKTKLTEKIAEYETKIRDLKLKIKEFQKKVEIAEDEISSAESRIQDTKGKFDAAYKAFTKSIQMDIELISNIL